MAPQGSFHVIHSPYWGEHNRSSLVSVHRDCPSPTSHKFNSFQLNSRPPYLQCISKGLYCSYLLSRTNLQIYFSPFSFQMYAFSLSYNSSHFIFFSFPPSVCTIFLLPYHYFFSVLISIHLFLFPSGSLSHGNNFFAASKCRLFSCSLMFLSIFFFTERDNYLGIQIILN